jgi:hypothetical protein
MAGKRRGRAGLGVKDAKLRKALADIVQDKRLDLSVAGAVTARLTDVADARQS